MSNKSRLSDLVAFDHWSWLFFVVWFSVGLGLHLAGMEDAGRFSFWGIILLLVCYHLRLLFVAHQFRQNHQPQYRRLTYLLLAFLLISIAVQLVR